VSTTGRYGSRYGSSPLAEGAHTCLTCGVLFRSARARYCSPRCRQRAYRLRRVDDPVEGPSAATMALQRRQRLVAQTIYECPVCAERYLGERRCPDCNRFCRALGLGGACPHCDQPILVAEVVGEEGRP
jgi:hypothetical protein